MDKEQLIDKLEKIWQILFYISGSNIKIVLHEEDDSRVEQLKREIIKTVERL